MKEDISSVLLKRIEAFEAGIKGEEVGRVIESGDGIVRIKGLPSVMSYGLIEFQNDVYGIAFNLERDQVTAVLLSQHTAVKEGDTARLTGRVVEVPVGEALLGRVVNALGEPLDGLGEIKTKSSRPVERLAPQVIERNPVGRPLQTGYKLVDAAVPVGRGQRELIIGDRSTGKSTMAIDAIISQKGQNVFCVYVAIGQKESTILQTVEKLEAAGALNYTTIVSASASDPTSMQYLAPYAGCAMAEEFMYTGRDALIIYDDLTKHAQAYRMISLLLRRPPGREAYPGDVFYLHSRLLERAAQLSPERGGGSMTALPIIETQLGDVSSYIPTNVISITDGQIFLETDLFNQGVRPAVNVGVSVSRVGGAAQIPAMRKIAGRLRLDLAQYREKQAFALFAGEIDKETLRQLNRGALVTEIFKQDKLSPFPVEDGLIILYAAVSDLMDDVPLQKVREFEKQLIAYVKRAMPEHIGKIAVLDEQTESELKKTIGEFKEAFNANPH